MKEVPEAPFDTQPFDEPVLVEDPDAEFIAQLEAEDRDGHPALDKPTNDE
jgi:hypothetical protein